MKSGSLSLYVLAIKGSVMNDLCTHRYLADSEICGELFFAFV